ncbi:DUF3343 domain-containing protein [Clostridium algidicarnis]|uniref:DUF3343 domain-containing protein n=1 Tax=Clostridium algidicarnis TaxID=37659 RepID=UPI001C0CC854|nr:DUF3343 domain-containing protein [Clostridium algidicarnis]MBU3210232.1 DUF3343 domain-containing protein [Clostridium algidicarnis]MBU3228697.1 DUF3343 domain-containing protein [Clostridium algidicarnis]MBU3251257.1 DUF3343 domain-containing protein [Clostridium algidicarnis]
MKDYYLIVFKNTHDAIESEKILKDKGIKVIIMPTPTYITQSCGISIKFSKENYDLIRNIIDNDEIHIKTLYYKSEDKFEQLI